jgi:uncharacterized membrane protein
MYRLSGNSPKVLNAKKEKNHKTKTPKKKKKSHKKNKKRNFVARIKVILIALLSGKCNNAWEFCTLPP